MDNPKDIGNIVQNAQDEETKQTSGTIQKAKKIEWTAKKHR
jgi:hypothetical protein